MPRRLVAIALTAALVAALCGCGAPQPVSPAVGEALAEAFLAVYLEQAGDTATADQVAAARKLVETILLGEIPAPVASLTIAVIRRGT